jgi:hypothetical protein
VAEAVKADYGSIDILVHSLANGPEVWSYLTDFLAVKRKYNKDAEHTHILALKILSRYLISEEFMLFPSALRNLPVLAVLNVNTLFNCDTWLMSRSLKCQIQFVCMLN